MDKVVILIVVGGIFYWRWLKFQKKLQSQAIKEEEAAKLTLDTNSLRQKQFLEGQQPGELDNSVERIWGKKE